jgi:hypothetical protein
VIFSNSDVGIKTKRKIFALPDINEDGIPVNILIKNKTRKENKKNEKINVFYFD